MKVARSVAEILSEHTTLALECIDRLYLNVYVPVLQRAAGAAYFFADDAAVRRCDLAERTACSVPSSALMAPRRRECSALSAAGARPGRPTRGWSTRRRW